MKKGFIYILSNNSLKENLLKIGKTSKETADRTKQLSSSTSIPENFEIEEEFEFSDINWAERKIHSQLAKYRYNKRKEFFNCKISIAKQAIIETQIEDKKREISTLKNDLKSVKDILSNSEFLEHKWKNFFQNLNWNFKVVDRKVDYLQPNFILETKSWDIGPKGEMEISNRNSKVFVCPELSENPDRSNLPYEITELIEQPDLDSRLIFVNIQPKEEMTEIIFGWEYILENEKWEKRKFIETKSGFGLFDEDRTWFDFVNGESVERDGLYPNKSEIMKLWNE
ncbi:GIY-YIG nuclease family protein [Winogradskyella poriferorum]|uniref:GIY-YIG nuclease family protein n=1 Tax=Winogradskyella poriferorum TaxID=307627 RepID=A0ABU7W061_9FLAO